MTTGQSRRTESGSLPRAKRLFIANLVFFLCLSVICVFIFSDEDDDTMEVAAPEQPLYVELSDEEIAHVMGEIDALIQRPETMPTYEEAWVMALSRNKILRKERFSYAGSAEIEELAQHYFEGYTKRFKDYYDQRPAYELGYKRGLEVDPKMEGFRLPTARQIYGKLDRIRASLENELGKHDHAEWILFRESYYKGFEKGFFEE